MDSKTIRDKFIKFFTERGHKEIAPAPLVPENDPTTLFTSSGMQPLVPYLLGQEHPEGKRLVNSQPSFRAEDIEEVGDNRHTTFFEMLGNWSLGDPASPDSASQGGYFKKEQLTYFWDFLTKELNLPKEKLYVSVFEGNDSVPKDMETYEIWKSLGVSDDRIFFYGVEKNWWSRSGPPDKMPPGEPGGPDSEVFYEFTQVEDNPYAHYNKDCHPNCDCGRFLEVGNSVFIQYQKKDGKLKELSQKNVDFGGGLERITAAALDTPDIFQTDLFTKVIDAIANLTGRVYQDETVQEDFRVIIDHMKAATFLIVDGVEPSNKLQGYILRRLLRRSAVKFNNICGSSGDLKDLTKIIKSIFETYDGSNLLNRSKKEKVESIVKQEMDRFNKTLSHGLKEVEKIDKIDGKIAFDLYQTFGFPYEVTEELFRQKGQEIDKEQFKAEFEKHRQLSRKASAGMFKGGLADHSEIVTKYHTATHLLHQALRDVLGPTVFQKGSNITSERLRFDFSYHKKMTPEEMKKVEDIINERIKQDLKVDHMIIPLEKAKSMDAIGLFDEKYADKVSVYGVGPNFKLDPDALDLRERGGYYSLEFCGGPHVEHTGVIGEINRGTILHGKIKIIKEEAISAGMRRIRAF